MVFSSLNFEVSIEEGTCKFIEFGSERPCELLANYKDLVIIKVKPRYEPLGPEYCFYLFKPNIESPGNYLGLVFKYYEYNAIPIKIRDIEFKASEVVFDHGDLTMIDFPIYIHGKEAIVAKEANQLEKDRVLVFGKEIELDLIRPDANRYVIIEDKYLENHKVWKGRYAKKHGVVYNKEETYLLEFPASSGDRYVTYEWSLITDNFVFVTSHPDYPILNKSFKRVGKFEFDNSGNAELEVDNKILSIVGYMFKDPELHREFKPRSFNGLPIEFYKIPKAYNFWSLNYKLDKYLLRQVDKIFVNGNFKFLFKDGKPKYFVSYVDMYEAVGNPDVTKDIQYVINENGEVRRVTQESAASPWHFSIPKSILRRIGYWKIIKNK